MKLGITYRTRPRVGEAQGGDAAVVRADGRRTLFGVIDALGPDALAIETARRATSFLEHVSLDDDLPDIIGGLHRALHGTRGAVATLCVQEGERLAGIGVGNVELRATSVSVTPVFSSGILGLWHGQLRQFAALLCVGARVIVFSDGISRRFDPKDVESLARDEACARILAESAYPHDAATVLIAEVDHD